MNFPNLSRKPSLQLEEHTQLKTLKSPTEDGYVITRPLWTRARKVFHVVYETLPMTDWSTLKNFFETSTKGGAEEFVWTHPITNDAYNMRFLSDTLSSTTIAPNRVRVEFDLEEV